MQVKYKLQGTYYRTLLSGKESSALSLTELLQKIQAVATKNHRRSPQLLRQSYGLNFLPESVLINLLQKANGVVTQQELYQVPSLKLLHQVQSHLTTTANIYSYQFITDELTLNLPPDHPQLPIWIDNYPQQQGNYTITLNAPIHSELPPDFSQHIWKQALNYWQQLVDIEKINLALQSLNPTHFYFNHPQNNLIQVWINIENLPLDLRAAITFLRLGVTDTSILSNTVKKIVEQYQLNFSLPSFTICDRLQPEQNIIPASVAIISNSQNRSALERIIAEARQFLLVSSYIIEDEQITALICEQSRKLPQGVWILTDLRNEIIDKLDIQISASSSLRQEYQNSDFKKKRCLGMLLDAKIPIRSGNFHLKTYITEQYAYLGSCNLTGGSLNRNLEAGVVWKNTPIHAQLINIFKQYWQYRAQDEIFPINNIDGFHLRSLHPSPPETDESYPQLLTPYQYQRDLIKQLGNFKGKVQIYTRSFQPSPQIAELLSSLDTHIWVDTQLKPKYSKFTLHPKDNLHAKITIIGEQVAYIGGTNFNFSDRALSLIDLMYKTTSIGDINRLSKQIQELVS